MIVPVKFLNVLHADTVYLLFLSAMLGYLFEFFWALGKIIVDLMLYLYVECLFSESSVTFVCDSAI